MVLNLIFLLIVAILFLARLCLDFMASKPSAWDAEARRFWIATLAFVLFCFYVNANDPRAVYGSGYLLLFLALPGWLILLMRSGSRALIELLGKIRG